MYQNSCAITTISGPASDNDNKISKRAVSMAVRGNVIMPPASKLKGHIGLGLSVQ